MNLPDSFGVHRYSPGTCLKITGEDAYSFLQGQFTQDLSPTKNGAVAYGLWLDRKGKVTADSFVWRETEGSWRVVSYHCPPGVVIPRLESFIIADDVQIVDETRTTAGLVCIGEASQRWLMEKASTPLPENGWVAVHGGFAFCGRRGDVPQAEWIGPTATRDQLFAQAGGAIHWDEAALERVRIEAAIPRVPIDVGPTDLPNEAGLESTAISYTKGCYLGQEVMARLKSMGQVRRRLTKVSGTGPVPDGLPAALRQQGKVLGELRTAVAAGSGFIGLAMVSTLTLDRTQALLLEEAERTVRIV